MTNIIKGVDDICVLVVVVGCVAMMACGIDGEVKAILGSAVGYLFGKNSPAIVNKISNKTTT